MIALAKSSRKVSIYDLDRGDKESVDEFLRQNLNLVMKIAHKFNVNGVEFEDLVQEGLIGMYNAIMNFDTSKGYTFSTYAYPMISGTILRYIRDKGNLIRLPRKIQDVYFKYMSLIHDYDHNTVVEKLGLSTEDVLEIAIAQTMLSDIRLDSEVFEDAAYDIATIHNILGDKIDIENEVLSEIMYDDIISYVDRRAGSKCRVVLEYYEQGYTQREIAKKVGTSQVQVSRYLKKVRGLLENYLVAQK